MRRCRGTAGWASAAFGQWPCGRAAGWQFLPGLRGSVAQRVDGARVVTCVYAVEETVWLLTIFDKYEKDNIADKELKALVAAIP